MEIKWTEEDPETGEKRFWKAEHFAGNWQFFWKVQRRGDWNKGTKPTRELWEILLDALERRYQRREGVTEVDVKKVKKILDALPKEEED